ncbi:MAG: hypothetical protein HAW61_04230 [Candidatus Portiera sp.]|nr:hypothetical protein [Portiera sp.]
MNWYFLLTSAVLFAMLYYPVHKMIYIMSVRRMQKKLKKDLNDKEQLGQKRRAHFVTIILLVIFSAIYNSYVLS